MYCGQLALPLPARREAIGLTDWRAVAAFRGCNVLECNGAFQVLAGEHGGVFPLHKHADVRGHGRERDRESWLRVRWQLIGRVGSAAWLRSRDKPKKDLDKMVTEVRGRANGASTRDDSS